MTLRSLRRGAAVTLSVALSTLVTTGCETNAGRSTSVCPAAPPEYVAHSGPSDRLFTGNPTSATLCKWTVSPPTSVELTGTQWTGLEADLVDSPALNTACPAIAVGLNFLLVLHYPNAADQQLIIDRGGCYTVANGEFTARAPTSLKVLLAAN